MSAGPNVTKAKATWGETIPEWVLVLAQMCDHSSQQKVAAKIGYTPPVVTSVIGNKYRGSLTALEKTVKGAFLDLTVDCPALGELPGNDCLKWQRKPLTGQSGLQTRVWRACRGIGRDAPCPHYHGSAPSPGGRPSRGSRK